MGKVAVPTPEEGFTCVGGECNGWKYDGKATNSIYLMSTLYILQSFSTNDKTFYFYVASDLDVNQAIGMLLFRYS